MEIMQNVIKLESQQLATMRIQVEIKNVYGNEAIYPVCDKARGFAELLNQKTLTRNDIAKIKAIGFEVIVTSNQPATL
jgi:hypothetical protein